ncbi:alpha/beta fold hydrolase [Catenulispora subtropica]|uniref:Alpha/beta hydrolase n=1 Tax=Catenulispora subtropica TaxID=450798 RepID=A0ABP5E6R9_9ACTN
MIANMVVALLSAAAVIGPPTPPPTITWGPCPQPEAARYGARCGTLTVPVDWADPAGPTIGLALLRIPATGTATGTVVADSEDLTGFGGSQISFFLQHGSNYLSRLPRTHATKDIVVFDPRGLGASAPLACTVPGHDPKVSSFPVSRPGYADLLAHNTAVAAACHGTPRLPAHMGLHDQVRDLDALRTALGSPHLDWLGQVAGGELGAAYAATFPATTGRIVLDSSVDPYRSAADRARDAATAEETAFAHFTAWCAQAGPDACALSGRDPGQVLDQAVALADAGGVSDGSPHNPSTEPRSLTGAEVRIAVGQFLVGYPFAWTGLSHGIADAAAGDGSTLAAIAAMTYADPDYTASRAQTCTDSLAPGGVRLRSLSREVARIAPHTGGVSLAWEAMAGCVGWSIAAVPPPPGPAKPASTVLVTATTGDPISPAPWSLDVAAHLVGSRTLIANVDGHGAFDNSPCAASAIDAYLADGTLPASGTVCR